MRELKLYTPRSSFEAIRQPTGFLSLPVELRIRIYQYTFTDVIIQTLLIKRFHGETWLYRRRRVPQCPGILLLNKQTCLEAVETLHEYCFRTASQVIAIRPVQNVLPQTQTRIPKDWNNICTYQNVREIIPVLRSLPRIKLEVEISEVYEQQVLTLALVRWMRAVVNSRDTCSCGTRTHLESLDVVFRLPGFKQPGFDPPSLYSLRQPDGVLKVMCTAISNPEVHVCYTYTARRPNPRQGTKFECWEELETDCVMEELGSVESCWQALENALKRANSAAADRLRGYDIKPQVQGAWWPMFNELKRAVGR